MGINQLNADLVEKKKVEQDTYRNFCLIFVGSKYNYIKPALEQDPDSDHVCFVFKNVLKNLNVTQTSANVVVRPPGL